MDNMHSDWRSGFVPENSYFKNLPEEEKEKLLKIESKIVRACPDSKPICSCDDPRDAVWIARRLNLAAILEEMTYNFATGKIDGQDIVKLVRKSIGVKISD